MSSREVGAFTTLRQAVELAGLELPDVVDSIDHPSAGEWQVESFVVAYDEGQVFGWAVVDADNPGARWRFELEPIASGTRLRFAMSLGPGPSGISMAIAARPDKEPQIPTRRVSEHHANMSRTVEGIKQLVETGA